MLIVNTVEAKYDTPEFIIVKNVAKYKLYNTPRTISVLGIPINEYKKTMTFEEMLLLNPTIDNKYFDNYVINDCISSMESCFKEHNTDSQIINEILDHTYFERYFEEWNITDICRKYNISGRDVFVELCSNEPSYGDDVEEEEEEEDAEEEEEDAYFPCKKHNRKTLGELFDNTIQEDKTRYKQDKEYVHFDYIIGSIGVKNNFPIDVFSSPFVLQMRRFNSRNHYCGYYRLLQLFIRKIKQGHTHEFTSITEQMKALNNLKTKGQEQIEQTKEEKITESISYNNSVIDDMGNIEHYEFSWNWRNRYQDAINKTAYKNIDPTVYDLKETYETYFKDAGLKLDLAYYFKLSEIQTMLNNVATKTRIYDTIGFGCELNNISIINILLFSTSRVNYESLNNLLEFVRLKPINEYCSNGVQIDNYIVKHRLTDNPKYSSVEFVKYDEYDMDLKFAKSLREKTTVARYFVTVAQEYPPETINMHNFYMMLLFKENNEMFSDSINSSVRTEARRLDDVRKVE